MTEHKAALGGGVLSRILLLYGPRVPLEHHVLDRLVPASQKVHAWHSSDRHSKEA
jgi:hypothetical protein